MFELMTRYYEHVERQTFDRDFESKTWVIVARCPTTGDVKGFSTQWFGDIAVGGSSVGVLYSGDTIVDQAYWSNNPLATMWGRLALELIDRRGGADLYWFLISKGYKTYRFLPVFFKEFAPAFDRPCKSIDRRLIDQIASDKFGDRYAPATGIVRAEKNGCRLRPTVARITKARMHDPHVRYFAEQNPGHARGDELCCLAPLSRENFNEAAYRVIAMPFESQFDTESIESTLRQR